jgi:hypothetical protein
MLPIAWKFRIRNQWLTREERKSWRARWPEKQWLESSCIAALLYAFGAGFTGFLRRKKLPVVTIGEIWRKISA